ncbi:GntR family transcriptional regulator [Breznakiella homolactica]|uniref:GntR family transcriptional regulator n=1 Tax=Breznakiella homolactica TaxID=2798577 RepID=A0A7T7XQN9_9SPIR|nr:GntR family transcriptional regulator [Breznakiella homolactica]QQO10721.1 GntR family transcriptional regulator [Breznakiella homolactica]
MTLDTKISVPLYIQLKNILQKMIENGTFKEGEQIPTEAVLCRRYHVSRITVRNALKELEKENLLQKIQGKGTFVSERNKLHRTLSVVAGFSEVCREQNRVPGAKVVKSAIEDASEDDIRELNLPADAKVYVLERIRYADNIPVSIEYNRFTEDYSFLLHENLNDNSLYDLLGKKHHISFKKSVKILEVIFCNDYDIMKYLSLEPGYPLLQITSVVSDHDDKKVYRSRQLIIGDKFKLMI